MVTVFFQKFRYILSSLYLLFKMKIKLRAMAKVVGGGTIVFTGLNIYNGNEKFYTQFVMPLVHWLDPETAHEYAVKAAKYGFVPRAKFFKTDALVNNICGLRFSNPVGVAAGFDKHCEAAPGLFKAGFSFVETGTVTPKPQDGNPKPRVFRLKEDEAVINRYGFNSVGYEVFHQRLKEIMSKPVNGVIGVSLGKNKASENAIEDYVNGIKLFGCLSDYIAINISSPNTPGLRKLQNEQSLDELMKATARCSAQQVAAILDSDDEETLGFDEDYQSDELETNSDDNVDNDNDSESDSDNENPVDRLHVVSTRDELNCEKKPLIFLKIAPDLTENNLKNVTKVIMQNKIDGIIVCNTTIERPSSLVSEYKDESGGLSGKPLRERSTKMIHDVYSLTEAASLPTGGTPKRKEGSGGRRKTSARTDAIMKREVMQNPSLTASELKKKHPDLLNTVSIKTIQHRLQKDLHLPTLRAAKKPMLTEAMKKKRVTFCKKYKNWTPEQWRKVMFSDESTFRLVRAESKVVRRPTTVSRYDPKYTVKTMKHPASLMVWGGFSGNTGRGGLYFLPVNQTMKAITYTDVLENHLLPFWELHNCRIPIIGVGGISTGADAYNKIKEGASLVQLYTSMVYKGPVVANKVNAELLNLLESDGYKNIRDAIGSNHAKKKKGSTCK
ncbi:Dihydroorotate dehydrogenase (quinone), mitochondrial [Nymphon striatum]|nr:Dihydroorotate dehydrogenase (quinone), mitochondrial [Nymphon striatum]